MATPVVPPKPASFYTKVIVFTAVGFLLGLATVLPTIGKAGVTWQNIILPLVSALVTGVAYALDSTHKVPTEVDVDAAVEKAVNAAIKVIPLTAQIAATPIVGQQLVQLADGEAEKLANTIYAKLTATALTATATGAPK